jgi:sterol 3beta-glucosyltransferase
MDEDSQTDVCVAGEGTPFNMNQSFFQMLTATTSRMSSRFDDDSEDDDGGSPYLSEPTTPTTESTRGKATSGKRLEEKGFGLPGLRATKESRKDKGKGNVLDSVGGSSSALAHTVSSSSAPIMSQMLQAQAQMNSPSFAVSAQLKEAEMFEDNEDEPKDHPDLAKRLTEIFNLPETEEVVSGGFRRQQLSAV